MSHLEDNLTFQLWAATTPKHHSQYRAIHGRRFAWDFAWPEHRLLVEVQGGTFAKGKMGHSTGMGQHRDMGKGNLAVLEGWRVLYFDEKMVKSGQALRWVQQALSIQPLQVTP